MATGKRGNKVALDGAGKWDGTKIFVFKISRESDADWAKYSSKRNVNIGCTFLNGSMIKMYTKLMAIVAWSTTEAWLNAAILEAMDMMMAYYIIWTLKLTVELPMKLYIDNKSAVDLPNNWSIQGKLRHVVIKKKMHKRKWSREGQHKSKSIT